MVVRAIEDTMRCDTRKSLFERFDAHTTAFNFPIVSYQHMLPIGLEHLYGPVAIYSKGYPEPVTERYVSERLYANDPLLKTAMRTGNPFWWWDVGQLTKLEPEHKEFMDLMRETKIGDGLAIPTFGPNGRNGFIGLGLGLNNLKRPYSNHDVSLIQAYCQAVHLKYCVITQASRKKKALSKKEIEVMVCVARGRSTNEISEKMGLSANTINTHLKRIYHKLDVTDRVSATLRFLALGYIYE